MADENSVFFSDDDISVESDDNKHNIRQAVTTVVPVAYADETLDTRVLLQSWNVKKNIVEVVVAAKLTIWHLRVIEDEDIARLFGNNIADCVEFKYYLKKWRNEGAKIVETPLPANKKVQLPQVQQISDPLEQYSGISASTAPPSNKDSAAKVRKHVSREEVEKVLRMSARGKSILQYYSANERLEPQHQAWLVDIIADYYLQKYDGVSMKLIDRVSDQIIQLFPTELKSTYYVKRPLGGNPKGKLHDKFRNKRRLYIAQGILKKK
ncbi:uncharacterized protein LOC129795679 isoform X1 [Lutzomyia longipalpis]|uniref:uncharacterized protein LOC129795679 isoform X1 n=1 Tax=Lutzomyia longipalpis TaxID=7200 RepID=UPI0024844797|nr:uncharacterized protein LOC129795679 isoform X1 [Lutzomyia longipalpis]